MHATQIIKRPLITEKGTWEGDRHNRYSFVVDRRANKGSIRAAVEQIYDVRVEKVRTMTRKGKKVRNRFGIGQTGDWKKAVVQLHPDDRIDLI
ncbi:MAG: 50S ribosomal protein L23 [Phycisphaeraceae bacterium]|nr:50S ribosomal protein L23 [Phycisphaeraceae bacterium]